MMNHKHNTGPDIKKKVFMSNSLQRMLVFMGDHFLHHADWHKQNIVIFFNHRSIVKGSSLYNPTWKTHVIVQWVIEFNKILFGSFHVGWQVIILKHHRHHRVQNERVSTRPRANSLHHQTWTSPNVQGEITNNHGGYHKRPHHCRNNRYCVIVIYVPYLDLQQNLLALAWTAWILFIVLQPAKKKKNLSANCSFSNLWIYVFILVYFVRICYTCSFKVLKTYYR